MGVEFYGFQSKEIVVQRKGDNSTIRCQSVIIGSKVGKYVIIENPIVNGSPLLCINDVGIVRYLDKGTVYGFESNVISVLTMPGCLAFLKFPPSVEEKSLRKNIRVRTILGAKISLYSPREIASGQTKVRDGVIVNISETGCLLSYSEEFHQGAELKLDIDFPQIGRITIPKCIVRRIEKNKANYLYGMEFANLELSKRDAIADFVSFCQSYSGE